jgi:hypothetical protein
MHASALAATCLHISPDSSPPRSIAHRAFLARCRDRVWQFAVCGIDACRFDHPNKRADEMTDCVI